MHLWLQLHQPNDLDTAVFPAVLLPVAGAPLLAHMLGQLADFWPNLSGMTITAVSHPEQIAAWLKANLPDLKATVTPELVLPAVDPQEPLLVLTGQAVIIADYVELIGAAEGQEETLLRFVPPTDRVIEQGNTAVVWLRHAHSWPLDDATPAPTAPAIHWYPLTNTAERIEANVRLLAIGYGSDSAVIERSYVEGFTVLPPVFIHDEAEIDAAIIGPYTSIGAGTVVKNSVVRRTIIAENCHIEDIVLTDSLISPDQELVGEAVSCKP